MAWTVYKGGNGWRVRWEEGDKYVSFSPNQHGRVISVGYHGYSDCCWVHIHAAAAFARAGFAAPGPNPPVYRHGARFSPERHRFCEAVAAKLNADGVAPPADEAAP